MKTIIIGKNIVKIFGKGEEKVGALNGVDVEISKGEFVAVMGSSGSGKSTLLFALSGMDNITSGSVKFCDIELAELGDKELADIRRTRMGFVFQQPTMLKNLNLLDNIILPAMQGNKKNITEITQKAKMLMNKTGISGLEKRDVAEVSGGQLQRAGICRALINSPEILFADEPTGALNSKSADEILDLLSQINKDGTAILLVTHDAKVAARADRVLFTKDGTIVSDLLFGKSAEKNIEARTEKIVSQMAVAGI
jgi:putative ABC transport system ATP-binding protein